MWWKIRKTYELPRPKCLGAVCLFPRMKADPQPVIDLIIDLAEAAAKRAFNLASAAD